MIWWRKKSFIQISQRTLVSLFPFFLLATCTLIVSQSIFSKDGYINNLFSVNHWFPFFKTIGLVLTNFTAIIGGMAGPLATYFSAKYTAGYYKRSTGTAGITAFIFSLIINSRELFAASLNDGLLTRINLPVTINLAIAIFIGYLVGQIFRFSVASDDYIVDEHYIYHPKSLKPIAISMGLALILNFIFYVGTLFNVFTAIGNFFSNLIVSKSNLLTVFANTLMRSLSAWIGNSNPFNDIPFVNDPFALDNLNHALKYHSTVTVPHIFTETNLYDAYGVFSGIGGSLALLVTILWVSKSQRNRSVGLLSIFPSLFNHGVAFMVGIPVFFNFLFLIPFLLVPLVNVLLAAIMLYFKVIPPAVYPVPSGTPSVLYAFIGTGGSLRALAAGLVIFAVDVMIYLPFVKFNDRIHKELIEEDEKGGKND
ncbi:PTS sugar transporter subunit IIC [Streptococcus troglodytae]